MLLLSETTRTPKLMRRWGYWRDWRADPTPIYLPLRGSHSTVTTTTPINLIYDQGTSMPLPWVPPPKWQRACWPDDWAPSHPSCRMKTPMSWRRPLQGEIINTIRQFEYYSYSNRIRSSSKMVAASPFARRNDKIRDSLINLTAVLDLPTSINS